MRIGLDDIDPQIAQAMQERLLAPTGEFLKDDIFWGGLMPWKFQWQATMGKLNVKRKRDPSEDEKRAFELRKKRDEQVAYRAAGTVATPIFIAVPVIVAGTAGQQPSVPMIASGVATWIASTVAGAWWTLRATPKVRLKQSVLHDEMRAVFPLLTLTRAERVYCDALLLLTRIDTDTPTEQTMRETLQQLNTLVGHSRQLEQRRRALLPVMGMNNIQELEKEYGELGRRLDQTTDSVSRQSLQQSLQMCATRLENARMLVQSMERLNVQQEAITQTLSSALSAMARMQVAPEAQAAFVADEIAETVTRMNQQTYAVEQAVQEVLTLRAQ